MAVQPPRTRRWTAALFVSLAIALVLVPGASAKDESPTGPRIEPSTILVRFADRSAAGADIAREADSLAGITANGVHIVRLGPGRAVPERVAAYRRHSNVVYAEPNYIRSIDLAAPNDPSYSIQWGLASMRALGGWNVFPNSYSPAPGPKLAVADTGVDSAHPDLAANIDTANGARCLTGTCVANSALDDHGHGTHVAGIAGAVTNNGVGIAGVGFPSRIIPIKVLASNGSGSDASIASGIMWAAARGARVVNLSLGGYGFSQTICNAVASATSAGTLVAAAAGNDGSSTPLYPAACPGAIGIAATASDTTSPSWSNWGNPNVFASAPGAAIYSTFWATGSTYATLSGTSMATPHAAGLAALLFGQMPSRTPTDVKQILARSADKIGATFYPPLTYGADPYGTCSGCTWHPYYGYGEIDAQSALCFAASAAISTHSPTVAPTGGSVTITGPNVGCASAVSLGFVNATFTVDSPTQITATVPPGVGYGYWRVTTGAGTSVSPLVFTVSSPTISTYSPASGGVGSTVTVTGTRFTGTTSVTLGFVNASFTVDSPTQITATVPSGVSYGRWRVSNPVWTAIDPVVFTVTGGGGGPFTVSPAMAPAGSAVTLTGSGFTGATAVSLGFVNASFTVDSPTQITATVPPGVGYGYWRVTTGAGTSVSPLVFTVSSPAISSFSPTNGGAGSTVTITGAGFTGATSVTLGFVNASFTVDSPTQIRVTVPPGVSYGRWRVANPVWTAADPVVFTVS
jgi:thermitase